MLPFPKTWSKFFVELCGTMHNIYKTSATLLQCRTTSTIFGETRFCSTKKDFNEVKNVRRKKCSQSEPASLQGVSGNFEETPALLTALNAVEILDSKFPDKEDCNDSEIEEGAESLLESINSVAAQSSLIGCAYLEARNNKNIKSQHMFYSKDHTQLQQMENQSKKSLETPPIRPDKTEATEDDRSYIINIFLNENKQDKHQKDAVDVHVKDLDITPNDVCVKKLAENIRKSYPAINKILQEIPDQNDKKKRLVGKLEQVWADVFKESLMQIPQASRNMEMKQLGMIQDRKIIQHDDPIVRAAQIDEAIKSNSLYKKKKRKSKGFAANFDDRLVREDFDPKPIIPDAPIENKADDEVLSDIDLVSFDVEAPENPVVVNPVPVKKINKTSFRKDIFETSHHQEIAPPMRLTNKTQDNFDPIVEPYPTLVDKDVIKEQLKKYKPANPKLETYPPKDSNDADPKNSRGGCKRAVEDDSLIVPIRDFPRLETLRPVPLVMGKRLKHYNKKTQDKIEEVVKLASETQQHHKNTLERMVSFCKDLLKGEKLTGRSTRFLDGQTRPRKLFKQKNARYSSFTEEESSEDSVKKVEDKDENEVSIPTERKIAPMVRSEEVFGSQHEFQQRCGVRERILPSAESSFYKGGYRKLSYCTNNGSSAIILRNSSQNRFDLTLMLYIFQRSYASKDQNKDPCGKVDEKAKLKPCSVEDCKKGDAKTLPDEICEPFKCETDPEIDKIVAGEIGCTAKCLVNRVPDEKAKPEPIEPPSDEEQCDPRYESEVEPEVPKFDIMKDLSKYIKSDNKEVQSYYGDNGYKNLEYYKFNRHSFYDIQRHLAKSRNPQPDPYAEKKALALMRLKAMQKKEEKAKEDTSSKC